MIKANIEIFNIKNCKTIRKIPIILWRIREYGKTGIAIEVKNIKLKKNEDAQIIIYEEKLLEELNKQPL